MADCSKIIDVRRDGKIIGSYIVVVSSEKNKKYDVYKIEKGDEDFKKICSFGDKRYEHYKDQIGCYKHLDHMDIKRRELFWKRHKKSDNPNEKGFWNRLTW